MIYHFIGIGGVGMSALAHILIEKGAHVSGSEKERSKITDALILAGATVYFSYDEAHLPAVGTIVYGSAIKEDNIELVKAKKRFSCVLHRAELLANLIREKKGLLVAGTHGKTTTSALLAHSLQTSELEPSFAIGGMASSLGCNGKNGRGEYFVAEACESDGSFLLYEGYGAIITNIDDDHLDYWKDLEALYRGFETFIGNIVSKEHLLWCADDPFLRQKKFAGISYGFDPSAEGQILRYVQNAFHVEIDIAFRGRVFKNIQAPLIGEHNALNITAVWILAMQMGIGEAFLRSSFKSFCGVGRRMEKKAEVDGVTIYDDYGHHPTEITATLKALKAASQGQRVVVVFQPHRYSRTKQCIDAFAKALIIADVVVLTDIYGAGEKPIEGITEKRLFELLQKERSSNIHYAPRSTLCNDLKGVLRKGDILLTMGAGDITQVGESLKRAQS